MWRGPGKNGGSRRHNFANISPRRKQEAEWVAERIEALRGTAFTGTDGEARRGLDYGDMAILPPKCQRIRASFRGNPSGPERAGSS